MADELNKKKPDLGSGSSSMSAPKQNSTPKSSLAPKQNAKPLSGAKMQPGSPFKSETTPVGVQKTKFESNNHVEKRLGKMFNETKQPTLGVWNHEKKNNPMAKPDQVKVNPDLKYKPTNEQLQAAHRKRIMQAGFAPKNWDGKSDIKEPVSTPAPTKNPTPNPFKGNSMPGFEGMDSLWDNMMGSAQKVIDNNNNSKTTTPAAKKKFNVTLDGDHLGEIEADTPEEAERLAQQRWPGHPDDDLLSVEEQMPESEQRAKASELFGTDLEDVQAPTDEERAKWQAEDNKRDQELMEKYGWDVLPVGSENMSEEEIVDEMNKDKVFTDSHGVQWKKNPDKGDGKNYGYSRVDNPNITSNITADTGAETEKGWNAGQTNEADERTKASEMFGTDLNKPKHNYENLSQELDKGEMVNIDAGLLPYEYGFETNGHEDLAIDARKNPETGKYEVFMYPETENGPVDEPDESYPDHTFDTFDDLKSFIENGYKQPQQPVWDKNNEPGSGVATKELEEYVREQMKKDGGLNDNFIDAYVNNLHKDSKQADFWKQRMKDAFNGGNK